MVYKCYFDGSYTPDMSGCAFCVIVNNGIIHTNTYRERLQTPHHAETQALYILLCYIQDKIAPGSTIEIYGDDKTLIDKIIYSKNPKYTKMEIRLFYETLKERYSISLAHISSKKNKIAHALSRIAYDTQPNLALLDSSKGYVRRRYMLLEDILIPDFIKRSKLPSPENYGKRLRYFRQHGHDHKSKTIRIDSNGQMIAGYITYLVLKDSGLTACYVDVCSEKTKSVVAQFG